MPRLRQVPKDEATAPIVTTMYEWLFEGRDPVAEPGRWDGTTGDWWTVFANSPDILDHCVKGFGLYQSPERTLDPALRELGQIRAGYAAASQFVFSQHAKSMRELGMPEAQITHIPAWSVAPEGTYDAAERAVLAYTDCLVYDHGRVPDQLFAELQRHLDEVAVLGADLHHHAVLPARRDVQGPPDRVRRPRRSRRRSSWPGRFLRHASGTDPVTAGHVVLPDDEGRHTPDGEDLWNESYYCDFVRDDGSMGGWLRLGLYPNRQVAWWTTWIVWPDRPGVCSADYRAPVPPGDGLVSEASIGPDDTADQRIAIELVRPLESFRLAASAPAHFIDPPEAVYTSGEQSGTPAQLDLDLTWTTDGVPYHYDLTTRYEIPCLVTGTVAIGGETFTVDGQGQRDHSWGVRDWWAFGWCWCSVRLDDGTRVHLADIRMNIGIPDLEVFFGYIQQPEHGLVLPATSLSVTEDLGAHGFPSKARIDIAGPAPNRGRRRPRQDRPRGDTGRLRSGTAAQRLGRTGQPLPPGHGHLPDRRRPHRRRLDRVESARSWPRLRPTTPEHPPNNKPPTRTTSADNT